jgi:hypothetical protein
MVGRGNIQCAQYTTQLLDMLRQRIAIFCTVMIVGSECVRSTEKSRQVIRRVVACGDAWVTDSSETGGGRTREENGWVCEEVDRQ